MPTMNTPGLMDFGLKKATPEERAEYVEKLFAEILPGWLDKIEPYCAGEGKFMFGDKLTIADFWMGGVYVNNFANPNQPWGQEGQYTALLEKYPGFKQFGENFAAEPGIAEYVASRGACPF